MDPIDIIDQFYPQESSARKILIRHSRQVADKALDIIRNAPRLDLDADFVEEAAMLHDIGILMTDAESIGCTGNRPYICHGHLGKEMLEKLGLPRHARVCESHVGLGITARDIREQGFPLPERDMIPVTPEEKIICFADKFFSKNGNGFAEERSLEDALEMIRAFGRDKAALFRSWAGIFLE
jgi:uncharacterized protein